MSGLTGFAPNAKTGINPDRNTLIASRMTLTSDQLPILVEFNGRRYKISESRNGGLVMTGAPEQM